jgi:4'-phosphopantetheinyl transferase EntD
LAENLQAIDYLTETELSEFSAIQHHQRKKEYLSIRYILRQLDITDSIIYKRQKPYLSSDLHISISHNKDFAGLAISEFPCGFDIESISERVMRVRNKYLTEKEKQLAKEDVTLYTLFWSVKEAIYKWDNSHIDFRETIQILSVDELQKTVRVYTKRGERKLNYRSIQGTAILSWIVG